MLGGQSSLGQLIYEPIDAVLDALASDGVRCLNVPLFVWQIGQAKHLTDLDTGKSVFEVHLVGKEQYGNVRSFRDTFSIAASRFGIYSKMFIGEAAKAIDYLVELFVGNVASCRARREPPPIAVHR